ncbi:inner nuclear membrane protein Man1-like [Acipenser ruthenus]|uniref:inner nuclear membrane protein Man1-like n=1 Tax=Acipenser ruthenus TaxID=7906 RepID=UPI00145AA805|nr:inner nuclear membrane protein Man1-like [Acipenser ruthenus]
MAAAQLSDEELFSELRRLGFILGPVTESTRPVYLKKLKKLREEQPQQQRGSLGTRASKSRNSGGVSSNNNSNTAAGASGFGARPASNDVTYLSAARSPGSRPAPSEKSSRGAGKLFLGFSSDESDAESNPNKGGGGGRRERGSGHHFQQQHRPTPTSGSRSQGVGVSSNTSKPFSSAALLDGKRGGGGAWWGPKGKSATGIHHLLHTERGVYGEEDDEDDYDEEDRERGNPTLNGSRASCASSNSSQLAGGYSDSDEEEEDKPGKERHIGRRLGPRRSLSKSVLSVNKSARGVDSGQEGTGGGVIIINDKAAAESLDIARDREGEKKDRDGFGIGSGLQNRSSYRRESWLLSTAMGEGTADSSANNNHVSSNNGGGGVSSATKARYSSYNSVAAPVTASLSPRSNHSNHTDSNHAYSRTGPKKKLPETEEELLQQFRRDEVSSTGRFSAHYLSMFLLTAACLFFVLLGLTYLGMRGHGGAEADIVIRSHPFGSDFDAQYEDEERSQILNILLQLHDHLAQIAGEHDCGDHFHEKNRSLSVQEASELLITSNPSYEEKVSTALEWILRSGEDVGIRLIGSDPKEEVNEVSEIKYLESTHPNMSFICRFQRAFVTVINRMLIFLIGIGIVWGVLWYMKYRWRKEEEETRQMYDMVEKIIDALKSHNEACQESKDLQPYLPIPHVRDSLVQPQARKKMKKVWDRAVNFLATNESRIRTEIQRLGGEDFLVWRWTQPSSPCDKISIMPSKVWQGKAFPLDKRNSPPNSLTPCLKIRNMFDPVMEVGEDWHLAIHEAILEKCSDNDGIVHIAVDKNSREGCVYVKCLSAEYAGKAFKALHGSWFDGKLVTVKYLRLDRYHQRFPLALTCNTPLKASNMHMNTMSRLRLRTGTVNSQGRS